AEAPAGTQDRLSVLGQLGLLIAAARPADAPLQALAGHSFEMPLLSSSKVKPSTWRVEGVERLALGGASIDAVRVRRVLATGSDDPVIEAWFRSEERRGGKECRVGWAPMQHRG